MRLRGWHGHVAPTHHQWVYKQKGGGQAVGRHVCHSHPVHPTPTPLNEETEMNAPVTNERQQHQL